MSQAINVFTDSAKFSGIWSNETSKVVSNFPACKMLFVASDITTGATTWTDRVAGLVLNAQASTVFTNGTYGGYGIVASVTGTMPVIGDLYPVLIWTGRTNGTAVSVRVGDSTTGAAVELYGSDAGYVSADLTNYVNVNSVAPPYPFDGCMSLYADTDATNQVYKQFASTDNSSIVTANKTGVDGGSGVNATFGTLVNTVALPSAATSGAKMVALFCFTTPPTFAEINSACKWMAANPTKLYPGFAGMV